MKQNGRSERRESEKLADRLSNWRELIKRCERKPTRKRVHALRVVTLRVQAEVEDESYGLLRASHEAQTMLRFGKLAKKLRDALGAVRELDVWTVKLSGLRESLNETSTYIPRSSRETSRQLERLERRLLKRRERAGEKLVKHIEKWREDLLLAATHVEKSMEEHGEALEGDRAPNLLKEFAGIVANFPEIGEENLHEFRKRIKRIRYVAEIHGADPVCGRIAEALKRAQGAIGEWHDWEILARTARHGKHAKDVEAVELLSGLTADSYAAAIATCDRVIRQMADLNRELGLGLGAARKMPVRDETSVDAAVMKLA
jgi:CHAD domain-containing protein